MLAELTVEPLEAIERGKGFAVNLSGSLILNADTNNFAQVAPPFVGGFRRAELVDARLTVKVRSGATGEEVALDLRPVELTQCLYNDAGERGPPGWPFPTCSRDRDLSDGANVDCVGLGGAPDPDNPCIDTLTADASLDCSPGGQCDQLGQLASNGTCTRNAFCVTGDAVMELESREKAFLADDSSVVLFGLADFESTGATVIESGPNQGDWALPPADLEAPLAPNGVRLLLDYQAGLVPVVIDCTMALFDFDPDAVIGAESLASPYPDSRLISFPIR